MPSFVTVLSTVLERLGCDSPSDAPAGLAGILSNVRVTLLIPTQRLACNHHKCSHNSKAFPKRALQGRNAFMVFGVLFAEESSKGLSLSRK